MWHPWLSFLPVPAWKEFCLSLSDPNRHSPQKINSSALKYYESLPNTFTRRLADGIASSLKLNLKTSESYLSKLVKAEMLIHTTHNFYKKQDKSGIQKSSLWLLFLYILILALNSIMITTTKKDKLCTNFPSHQFMKNYIQWSKSLNF